jgi:hypothetical protein
MDPHRFGNLDPDPHKIKLKIHIRIRDKLPQEADPDSHQFADECQNVWNVSLFENIFKGWSFYLEARIWIRMRMKIRIRDPHQHQIKIRVRIK